MKPKIIAIIVSLVVFAAVVAAFLTIGSPAKQRKLSFDSDRVNDLQTIQSQIVNYWQQKNTLPANLGQLTDSISGFTAPKDPESNAEYEYFVKSNLNFQLCANFNLPSQTNSKAIPQIYPMYDNWDHTAGSVCFNRTIDPELYKPVPPR